jgi:hypothetical protein
MSLFWIYKEIFCNKMHTIRNKDAKLAATNRVLCVIGESRTKGILTEIASLRPDTGQCERWSQNKNAVIVSLNAA